MAGAYVIFDQVSIVFKVVSSIEILVIVFCFAIFVFVFLEKEIVLTFFLQYERSPMINPSVKIKTSFSNDISSGGSLKSYQQILTPGQVLDCKTDHKFDQIFCKLDGLLQSKFGLLYYFRYSVP